MTDRIALRGLFALPFVIGMAACSSSQVDTTGTPAVATDTVPVGQPAGAVAQAPAADTLAANRPADTTVGYQAGGTGKMTHTVALEAQNGSGFTGNAVFTDVGGGHVRVAVTLNAPANTDAAAQHDIRIHTGTCAAPGPEVKNLDDVAGNGESSDSHVDLSMTSLMDGNHIIVADENDGDRIVACAAIPSGSNM